MKKLLAAMLIVIAVICISFSVFPTQKKYFSDLCVTQTEFQQLTSNRSEADEDLFDRILFDEYELFYDAGENRFFYSLIENSHSAYNPYVKCIGSQKVSLAILGAEINEEIITQGTEYQLLVYTEDAYQCFGLAFTTLPLLSVDCGTELPGDLATDMKCKLFDNRPCAEQRLITSDGDIHIRGGWTRNFPKLGYKITLYSNSAGNHKREWNKSLLGLRADGDWVLYAAYTDQEKIRNVFSSKLWKDGCAGNNRSQTDNGMEYQYVELFLNDQYWGLYALGYPIDAQQLQLAKGEYVYEKNYPVMAETDIDFQAEGAPEGYVIREFGVNSEESWTTLKNYYQAMLYTDGDYTGLQEFADIDNSIDIFLFLNMIQGVDHASVRGYNTIYNLYLTNKRNADGTETILYTPWDMDRTWGNGFDNMPYDVEVTRHCAMKTNIAYLMLKQETNTDNPIHYEDICMSEFVTKRYEELRQGTWSDERLSELINEYEGQIYDSGAFLRDRARWPEGQYNSETERLDVFEKYVLDRMRCMDDYVSQYAVQ